MLIACAAALPAQADTPRPAGDAPIPAADAGDAASPRTPPPNSSDTSDPEFIRVAGFFRIGATFLRGHARRDSAGLDGTAVSLANQLDLSSPEVTGQIGLQFRPADDWRIFASFASGAWDGAHVQSVGTPSNPTVEAFIFDGVSFSGEAIETELSIFNVDVGGLFVLHTFRAGRVELGAGASYFKSELEIESLTNPGKDVFELTESGTPWAAGRLVLTDLGVAHLEVAGRIGFLWYGDQATYAVNLLLHFWAGVGVNLGPFVATFRLEYQLWETHQHSNSQDEVFGMATFSPTLGLTVRF